MDSVRPAHLDQQQQGQSTADGQRRQQVEQVGRPRLARIGGGFQTRRPGDDIEGAPRRGPHPKADRGPIGQLAEDRTAGLQVVRRKLKRLAQAERLGRAPAPLGADDLALRRDQQHRRQALGDLGGGDASQVGESNEGQSPSRRDHAPGGEHAPLRRLARAAEPEGVA